MKLGLNEIALIILIVIPFVYLTISMKNDYQVKLNREQRRKLNKKRCNR